MRIYEASIAYNLVKMGDDRALTKPAQVAEYLADAYAKTPHQETLWVICLDRKNKPISRTMVTMGTLTCALAHPRENLQNRDSRLRRRDYRLALAPQR